MCNTNIITIIVYTLVQTCLIVTRGFLNLLFDPYFNLRLLLPFFVCTYVVFSPIFFRDVAATFTNTKYKRGTY